MNIARAARALDVNERTLKLWIARAELSPYFSELARREGAGRDLNDDDVVIANTIRSLRAGMGNNNVDWQEIADRIGLGYRDRALPPEAASVDTGLTVVAQHERMAVVVNERDMAVRRAEVAESQLAEERSAHMADNERLLRELADQRERAARTEVELEMWRSGRLKSE
jgi:hypothetical protein